MKNQIQSKLWKKRLIGKVRAAFSLVELLVVIAVIGIIAAIAIPNIAGITGAGRYSQSSAKRAKPRLHLRIRSGSRKCRPSFATAAAAVTASSGTMTFPGT